MSVGEASRVILWAHHSTNHHYNCLAFLGACICKTTALLGGETVAVQLTTSAPQKSEESAKPRTRWQFWAPLAVCTSITVWLLVASSIVETKYLQNYGHFLDPAAYYYQNIECFRRLHQEGLLSALCTELTQNAKSPGRTIPYLLFGPQLLVHPLGHLATTAPALWLFLALLIHTVRARTKSLLFASAAATTFAAVPFLYDARWGLAAYWLDMASALSMGCSALCLINYTLNRKSSWLLACCALASITATFRYTAGYYMLAFLAVALPVALLPLLGQRKNRPELMHSLAACLIGGLPGLTFLVGFLADNRAHYNACGYAFGASLMQSFMWTFRAVQQLLSDPLIILLGSFTAISLGSAIAGISKDGGAKSISRGRADAFLQACLSVWLPLSIFSFVCLVVRAIDGYHPLFYFAPALVISAFCAFPPIRSKFLNRSLSVSLIAAAIVSAGNAFASSLYLARHPYPFQVLHRQAEVAIIRAIVKTRALNFVEFDEETLMPQVEAFLNYGHFCSFPPKLFSVHKSYLQFFYPRQTPESAAQSAYRYLKQEVALVAVFDDAQRPLRTPCFDNEFSSTIAAAVSKLVATDPHWRLVQKVNSPKGMLAIYSARQTGD